MFLLRCLIADYPSCCYNDQLLGTWEIRVSDYNIASANDTITCPKHIVATKSKTIKLLSPNVAIDADGYSGTWSIVYNEAVEVKVGGFVYSWYVDWSVDESNGSQIISNCSRSMPTQGWSHPEGVSQPFHACIEAVDLDPELGMRRTINVNGRADPGPVNPNATTVVKPALRSIVVNNKRYPLMPRRLGGRVKYGPEVKKARMLSGSTLYSGDKLPDSFDWRNVDGKSYVPPVFDEMSCGSCYACATLYMMMSRIMVANNTPGYFNNGNLISVEHAVDCNFYSQGCDGGFGEHVGKFAEDFGLLSEHDYGTYTGKAGACRAGDFPEGRRYYFQNTVNMGGYTGAVTDPTEIQWELYRHGPMAVSVMVDDKYFYALDPYGFENDPEVVDSDDPERHYFFDEVNHAVLLVGWVTEEIEYKGKRVNDTFWIVQNSWGEKWGNKEADGKQHGVIKIAMGYNAYGIESEPLTTYWRSEGKVDRSAADGPALAQPHGAAVIALGAVSALLLAAVAALAAALCLQRKRAAPRSEETERLVGAQ